MNGSALVIDGLIKAYGDTVVLRKLSLDMADGELMVLVGPSGCGKSTLLNCIAGLDDVTEGQIAIAGRDVTAVAPRDRDIAMVFQSYALYPTLSVAQNIGFGMRIRRQPKSQIAERVAQVAELLQIGHLLDRRPAQLSGGQRQRVAMGRALVREPSLFLFDEPLSNLDAKLRVEMRAEIKRVHETTGASIVYVTHDQVEAMTLATRIVVLNAGVIQQIGTPVDIYDRPANTFVADFMGSPPMNLLPATVVDDGQAITFGDGQRLAARLPAAACARSALTVGLRPEAFSRPSSETPQEQIVQLTPQLIENTGSDAYIGFSMNGQSVTARLSGRYDGEVGKPLALQVDIDRLLAFDTESNELISA